LGLASLGDSTRNELYICENGEEDEDSQKVKRTMCRESSYMYCMTVAGQSPRRGGDIVVAKGRLSAKASEQSPDAVLDDGGRSKPLTGDIVVAKGQMSVKRASRVDRTRMQLGAATIDREHQKTYRTGERVGAVSSNLCSRSPAKRGHKCCHRCGYKPLSSKLGPGGEKDPSSIFGMSDISSSPPNIFLNDMLVTPGLGSTFNGRKLVGEHVATRRRG
jgi:hypothetical protein